MARRRLTAPALACLAALAAAGCRSPEGQLERAAVQRRQGDPRGALATCQALLASLGEQPLPPAAAATRLKALKAAGDVAYLELGDFGGAIAYYRRIVSLAPGSAEALEARGVIGDIFRDRFQDRQAAIAQYADVAQSEAPQAPLFQLKVAREYLELGNAEQARAEARTVRERWPASPEADEAQLVTAQAWALDGHDDEAMRAFQALVDRHPAPQLVARALEGQAHLLAQQNKFDRSIELYTQALAAHPNPDAIRTNLDSVRRRREAARTVTPGNRNEAFDYGQPKPPPREITP